MLATFMKNRKLYYSSKMTNNYYIPSELFEEVIISVEHLTFLCLKRGSVIYLLIGVYMYICDWSVNPA